MNRFGWRPLTVAALMSLILSSHGLAQIERFVAPNGSNTGNCTVNACATISYALSVASNGDILHLATGEYTESLTIEKSVELRGAGQGSTFIQSHALPEVANQRVITVPGQIASTTELSISNLTIRHGSAFGPNNQGGGIYNDGNRLILQNVSINSNQAQFGGGIYSANNHDSSLTAVTFFDNHAFGGTTGGNGGGMYLVNSSPELHTVVFLANSVSGESVLRGSGAGIYMTSNSSPSLTSVVFSSNVAEIRGGGLFASDMSFPVLLNAHFSGNQANGGSGLTGLGGAIFINGGALEAANTRFINNSCGGTWCSGGAVYAIGGDLQPSRFVNALFAENTAERGTGLTLVNADVQVVNSTFSANVANDLGGAAIRREDSDLVLSSTIVWGNIGTGSGIDSNGSGTFNIGYSLIEGGCPASASCFQSISNNPRFVDPDGGNFQLQSHSPAITTGDPNADPASFPANSNGVAIDLQLNRRFRNGRIDMGPFEFQGTPTPPPGVPTLVSPANGATVHDLPVALEWQSVADATSYRVQVDLPGGSFDPPVIERIANGTTAHALGLDTETDYQWRVRARIDTIEGDWSDVWTFTTGSGITPGANNVLYVRRFAPGDESGNSWSNAITELADALQWAWLRRNDGLWDADNPLQIWVGAIGGTVQYLPQYRADDIGGSGGPNYGNAFVMVENVQIYGGFGAFETSPDQRDLINNKTTLTGGPGYYHVVVSAGDVGVARLDGFTITDGKAVHPQMTGYEVNGHFIYGDFGGAIYNTSGSPVLANLLITGNEANFGGGGIYTEHGSPQLINVSITNNTVNGGYGGAIHNESGSPLLRNVLIADNQAPGGGGGGMANRNDSHPTLVNVTFANNLSMLGGALYNEESSSDISNSIFWGSEGLIGTELFNDMDSSVTMTHSIYVDGEDGVYEGGGFSVTASHTTDPMFVDAEAGEYAIQGKSAAVQGGSNTPYLNAGGHVSNDVDLAGNPRISGGTIDIGAFEFQEHVVEDRIFADRFQNN
jgi:predicted outer membrane repeat protein